MKKITMISMLTTAFAMTAVTASAAEKDGVYATVGGTVLSTELDLSDIDVSGQAVDLGYITSLGTIRCFRARRIWSSHSRSGCCR